MPDLIIIAGPNGAGKTTFAREYLSNEFAGVAFVNADEIERALRAADPAASEIAAAREMLVEIDALIRHRLIRLAPAPPRRGSCHAQRD
jgi:predicted ABC-type ATPase